MARRKTKAKKRVRRASSSRRASYKKPVRRSYRRKNPAVSSLFGSVPLLDAGIATGSYVLTDIITDSLGLKWKITKDGYKVEFLKEGTTGASEGSGHYVVKKDSAGTNTEVISFGAAIEKGLVKKEPLINVGVPVGLGILANTQYGKMIVGKHNRALSIGFFVKAGKEIIEYFFKGARKVDFAPQLAGGTLGATGASVRPGYALVSDGNGGTVEVSLEDLSFSLQSNISSGVLEDSSDAKPSKSNFVFIK